MPKLIDNNEREYIPLNDAGKDIPGRPHRATTWRWAMKGVHRNGVTVKLETIAVGGRRFTTRAYIEEFLARCNGPETTPQPVVSDSYTLRAEAAGLTLESMGVR